MTLNDADAIYMGSALVDAVYVGDTLVWEPGGAPPSSPEHVIFGGDYPLSLGRWTDGGSSIITAAAFYRSGAATDGWRVKGGRVFVPAGNAVQMPATTTFTLFSAPYAVNALPNLVGTPIQAKTVATHDGWVEGRFDVPYAPDVGVNEVVWIGVTWGDGTYLYATGALANPKQADDGSQIYLADDASGFQARHAFNIDGGSTQSSIAAYGIDVIFDEG